MFPVVARKKNLRLRQKGVKKKRKLKAILFILLARVSMCQNLCKAIGLYILFTITVYLTYHNSTKGKNDQWLLSMLSQCWRGKMLMLKKKKKDVRVLNQRSTSICIYVMVTDSNYFPALYKVLEILTKAKGLL